MSGIKSVPHVGDWATVACCVISFIAYCISNKVRWRRFLVLLPIAVVLLIAWWLFAGGGLVSLVHTYREIPSQPVTGAHGAPTARLPAP